MSFLGGYYWECPLKGMHQYTVYYKLSYYNVSPLPPPSPPKRFDARLMSQIRDVVKTDSRSLFHVPAASSGNSSTEDSLSDSTQQFGVSLNKLRERSGEVDFFPVVIRKCVGYLEKEGLEVMGIFRRAPNNTKCRLIKRQFDSGKLCKY